MGKCPFSFICMLHTFLCIPSPPFRRSGDEPGELSRYKQKGHLLMGKCPVLFICMLHTFLYIPSPHLFAAAGTNGGNFPATSKKDTC